MKHVKPSVLFLTMMVFVTVSFGATISLGFVRDDYTNLYHVQQGLLLPYPYYADTIRLAPLYRLFHLTPSLYYATAVVLFGIATAALYWFSFLLSGKRLIAAITAVFFVFSLVGSAAMYSMGEAIRLTTYLIFTLTTMSFFFLFQKSGSRSLYILSVVLFAATVLVFPYRGFTFIAPFVLFSLLYSQKQSFVARLRTLLPFFFIFFVTYALVPLSPAVNNVRQFSPVTLLTTMTWTTVSNYLLTFYSVFVPTRDFTSVAASNAALPTMKTSSLLLTGAILSFVLLLKNTNVSRAIRFSLFSLMATLAGYSLLLPVYHVTTERYLMIVRPFLALFLGAILVQSLSSLRAANRKRRFLPAVVAGAALLIFIIQGTEHFRFQYQEIQRHGPPAKNTIAAIRRAIPSLPAYSIIFIDAETNELRDTYVDPFRVGALPASASLAVYYGTRYENIEIIDYVHCDTFATVLKRWEGKPVTVFYFLATEQGVVPGKSIQAFKRCTINEKGELLTL